MAILRKGSVPEKHAGSFYPDPYSLGTGNLSYRHLSEAGGLTHFGVALETLQGRSPLAAVPSVAS